MKISSRYKALVQMQLPKTNLRMNGRRATLMLHHSVISRFVRPSEKPSVPSYDRLLEILDFAGVDRIRAFISTEILNDPASYDHPGTLLLAGILPGLAAALCGEQSRIVECFTAREIEVSTNKLAEYINRIGDAKISQLRRLSEFNEIR